MIPEYRAWDKDRKKYSESLGFISTRGEYYDGLLEIDYDPQNCQFVLEQYTGLKDANGNKIFEGDIVKADQHGYNQPDSYVVKEFIQNVCVFRSAQVTDGSTMFEEATNGHDLTVIGNVHENLELLEVDSK